MHTPRRNPNKARPNVVPFTARQGEVWKDIPSCFIVGYQVSDQGRFRRPVSVDAETGEVTWSLVKPKFTENTMYICLQRYCRRFYYNPKMLMCVAFHGFPPNHNGLLFVEDIKVTADYIDKTLAEPFRPDNVGWTNVRVTYRRSIARMAQVIQPVMADAVGNVRNIQDLVYESPKPRAKRELKTVDNVTYLPPRNYAVPNRYSDEFQTVWRPIPPQFIAYKGASA